MKVFHILILFLFCLSFEACTTSDENGMLSTLQHIHDTGLTNPNFALRQMDSIDAQIDTEPGYVRMKAEMLRQRLQDIAYIMPKSDKTIKRLIIFFDKHGSPQERQEAYYLAGCTYRDLKDAPRAIKNFLHSERIAGSISTECDSDLLRCTYSNLSYLYSHVLNYPSCLEYAKKEYQISIAAGKLVPTNISHLAFAYYHCDSIEAAFKYLDMALEGQMKAEKKDFHIISSLLYRYVTDQRVGKADSCAQLIQEMCMNKLAVPSSHNYMSMGYYYQMKGNVDSATVCFERVLTMNQDLIDIYNASKELYAIHKQRGNLKTATEYAKVFIAVNDTLTLGKLQEEASTVNNWYQYARDRDEENRILTENQAYREQLFFAITSTVLVILASITVFLFIRNRRLLEKDALNKKIQCIGQENENVKQRLLAAQIELHEKEASEAAFKKKLAQVTQEVEINEKLLQEKIRFNEQVLELLRHNQSDDQSEDILNRLIDMAKKGNILTTQSWKQLYRAVDEQWPDFAAQVHENLPSLKERDKRICYLKKAGCSIVHIEKQVDVSHSTIHRFLKQNPWLK